MSSFWTLDDIRADMAISARGAETLNNIRTQNCSVEICSPYRDSPAYDPRMETSAGYFDSDKNRIVLNSVIGHDAAIVTLAHEGEHLRQHRDRELPRTGDTREEYLDKGLKAEAAAETAANQVAYELSLQNKDGPLATKLAGEYWRQTEAYVKARKEHDHTEAAKISEQDWVLNPYSDAYERQFNGQWNRIENYMQAAFPAQKEHDETSTSTAEAEKSEWRKRMEAKIEAAQLKPPEPPANAQKPTHGLSM